MPDGLVAKMVMGMDGKKMEVALACTPKGCVSCHAALISGIYDIIASVK